MGGGWNETHCRPCSLVEESHPYDRTYYAHLCTRSPIPIIAMTQSMGKKSDVEDFPMQHCQISICKGRDQRIDEFFHKNYSFSWLKAPLLKISRGCNRQSHETSQLSIPPAFPPPVLLWLKSPVRTSSPYRRQHHPPSSLSSLTLWPQVGLARCFWNALMAKLQKRCIVEQLSDSGNR